MFDSYRSVSLEIKNIIIPFIEICNLLILLKKKTPSFTLRIKFYFLISDMFNENEDESMQLITEVWVEPQSGRVVGENLAWTEAKGLTFDCIPELVFPIDNEIISCLLTCEHLSLVSIYILEIHLKKKVINHNHILLFILQM